MAWFKNLKIQNKLILLSSTISLTIMLITGTVVSNFLVINAKEDMQRQMKNLSQILVTQTNSYIEAIIQNYLRGISKNSVDTINYYYKLVKAGKMSEKEAKNRVKDILLSVTIGKTGYIYCLDSEGIIRVHPNKDLLNVDLTKYDFIKKQLEINSGYIEYMWKNPDEVIERPKALYMIYFKPWNWIVSVSSYRDEFSELIDIKALRKVVLSAVIGKTGYPFLIDDKGIIKIHPKLEGTLLTSHTDAEGNHVFNKILEKDQGSFSYTWIENNKVRNKALNFKKLKNVNWIMSISTYEDEFYDPMKKVQVILIISTVLGIFTFIISFYFIGKIISQPIKKIGETSYELASGNLTIRLKTNSKDEIGQMNKNLNIFIEQLNNIVFRIKTGANQISIAMEEINKANEELADKSMIQACSLEESSVTLKQISSLISINTDNTIELSEIMKITKEKANNIELISSNLNKSMDEIISSSSQIERIIDFIDDIAFQTNLLALNAAVEAARAGDSGKGFTVIALEVRDLARHSSDLSKQIKELTKESSLKIKKGHNLVDFVIEELKFILIAIEKTNQSVQTIAGGAVEQKNGIAQISLSIAQLDEIARANAEIAKSTSSMTKTVYIESKNFGDMLKIFKQD